MIRDEPAVGERASGVDKWLAALTRLTGLERLAIDSGIILAGAGLAHLRELLRLTALELSPSWALTGSALARVAALAQLRALNLCFFAIARKDRSLDSLARTREARVISRRLPHSRA